jgi:hypothetical protein
MLTIIVGTRPDRNRIIPSLYECEDELYVPVHRTSATLVLRPIFEDREMVEVRLEILPPTPQNVHIELES